MDLRENPKAKVEVTRQEGMEMHKRLGTECYMECSALTQQGLKEVFEKACQIVLRPKPRPKKKCVLLWKLPAILLHSSMLQLSFTLYAFVWKLSSNKIYVSVLKIIVRIYFTYIICALYTGMDIVGTIQCISHAWHLPLACHVKIMWHNLRSQDWHMILETGIWYLSYNVYSYFPSHDMLPSHVTLVWCMCAFLPCKKNPFVCTCWVLPCSWGHCSFELPVKKSLKSFSFSSNKGV